MARNKREKADERIQLTIEPSRLAAWREAANALGLPLNSWIRLRVDGVIAATKAAA